MFVMCKRPLDASHADKRSNNLTVIPGGRKEEPSQKSERDERRHSRTEDLVPLPDQHGDDGAGPPRPWRRRT